MKLFILISLLITIAVATKTETKTETDLEDEKTEIKGTTTGYHHYDLAILIIILAFKFKVVLLVLAAFFGFGSYNKLLSGIGGYYKGFNKCPPQIIYDTTHKHNRDYSNADRLDRGLEYSMYYEDMDLELLSNVMKGVGLTNPNFNITESGSCRRRLVCEADRMAHTKPILGYTMQLLRNLSRYRTPRSTNERSNVQICAALYPECRDIANVYRHENKYGLKTKPRRPPQDRYLANGT